MDAVNRYYLAKNNHLIGDDVLEKALESFEGAALKFSADAIKDAAEREKYNRNVKRVKAEVLAEVKAGRVSVKEAAEHCYEMRNKIMQEIRIKTSLQGRAVAEKKKAAPRALEELMDEKAEKIFKKKFGDLNASQKNAIHYEIIESSARPSAKYNTTNKVLNVTGKVLIVVTIAYAVYDIVEAENKAKEAAKQGATMAGGVTGTFIGSVVASLACGSAAPVCTIALMLAGGLSGGWAAAEFMDSIDQELEEFTRWEVN